MKLDGNHLNSLHIHDYFSCDKFFPEKLLSQSLIHMTDLPFGKFVTVYCPSQLCTAKWTSLGAIMEVRCPIRVSWLCIVPTKGELYKLVPRKATNVIGAAIRLPPWATFH